MSFYDNILNLLHKVYRPDEYVKALVQAVGGFSENIYMQTIAIKNNLFFDTLDLDGCKWWEDLLDIEPVDQIDNRRSRIKSKWNANNHNCIDLIQACCNAWKNGETIADFHNGKICIRFTNTFGKPDFIESLKDSIEEIKPAHIAYFFEYRFLLIREIHEVKTIEEMEQITIGQFMSGTGV